MNIELRKLLLSKYQNLPLDEILTLPPDALKGVSEKDAENLDEAFGIRTIESLGKNRYFHSAYDILRANIEPGFDPGPNLKWEKIFGEAPIEAYLTHPSERFRIDFGPVFYRGRLDRTARVLVVGQDPSTDEILSQRAFVGSSGQKLQRLLNKLGITRSYIIINTFIFSIYSQFDGEMESISLEPAIRDYRDLLLNTIIRDNSIQALITLGRGPRHAIENWDNQDDIPVFDLVHPAADEHFAFPSWNEQLDQMIETITPDQPDLVDNTPYEGNWRRAEYKTDIPRYDLPFGIPSWHGSGGTRSRRDPANQQKNIIWQAE